MTENASTERGLSGKRLILSLAGASVMAGVVLVTAVLPAEYNIDPLGIGRLTGLSKLWAPDEEAYAGGGAPSSFASSAPAVRHTVEIPLGAAGWPEAALEYKVAMKPGQGMIYSWTAAAQEGDLPAQVRFEFHGHTLENGETMTVAEYQKSEAPAASGSLTAPFEGIHGWYFENLSENPAVVRLTVEGFFDIIPPGAPGNEFRIRPKEDDQALK